MYASVSSGKKPVNAHMCGKKDSMRRNGFTLTELLIAIFFVASMAVGIVFVSLGVRILYRVAYAPETLPPIMSADHRECDAKRVRLEELVAVLTKECQDNPGR